MQDFEGLGVFYLGRPYDLAAKKTEPEPLLYDARDLTTHAVCVGMTGSGKTGLCLALLEEAAIDGIPAIAIDPKGDLGNLMLTFPQLRPDDFRPWLDPANATRQQISLDELASRTAEQWRKGLAEWGEDGARIGRFADAVERTIYTPGSSAGVPLTVLRSFGAPPKALLEDDEALRERVSAAVAGLLALVGIEADPLRSREHILIAKVLDTAWRAGRDVDMATLIRQIQSPPFDKVGVVDLESFYPAKQRFELAMSLNNLLASPGFASWMQGEPLDVQRLLYTPQGKPKLSIISIAHMSDAERMFFVTILLNEIISWMRTQSGTSSLRAILYMDEVFGFFPPSANPPSKIPMLTLLKQARAFGLGVVLATQNPVDLDYKGLANAGTWLLGRLQTERDKARLLDGLEGASAAAGAKFDRGKLEKIMSALGDRVFLMNNVHNDEPVVFQSRWALSFLRGPLTREQIRTLTHRVPENPGAAAPGLSAAPSPPSPGPAGPGSSGAPPLTPSTDARPILPPDVSERFIPIGRTLPAGAHVTYRPGLTAAVRLHYVQTSGGIDLWKDRWLLVPNVEEVTSDVWQTAEASDDARELEEQPEAGAQFANLAAELTRPKQYTQLTTALKNHLYRDERLKLWRCDEFKQVSKPGESEGDFRVRLGHLLVERRDADMEKLRTSYAPKVATLKERLRKAQQRVEKEKQEASQYTTQTMSSIGAFLWSFFTGGRRSVTTPVRDANRAARERQDVAHAEETVEVVRQQVADLEAECQTKIETMRQSADPAKLQLEELSIQPRKGDLVVSHLALTWAPWYAAADGALQRAW
jgi:hypothetical protein